MRNLTNQNSETNVYVNTNLTAILPLEENQSNFNNPIVISLKGITGLGSAGNVMKMNANATALEWGEDDNSSNWTLTGTNLTPLSTTTTISIGSTTNTNGYGLYVLDKNIAIKTSAGSGSSNGLRIINDTYSVINYLDNTGDMFWAGAQNDYNFDKKLIINTSGSANELSNGTFTYNLPTSAGTLALTSDIPTPTTQYWSLTGNLLEPTSTYNLQIDGVIKIGNSTENYVLQTDDFDHTFQIKEQDGTNVFKYDSDNGYVDFGTIAGSRMNFGYYILHGTDTNYPSGVSMPFGTISSIYGASAFIRSITTDDLILSEYGASPATITTTLRCNSLGDVSFTRGANFSNQVVINTGGPGLELSNGNYEYSFPNLDGTIALFSQIPASVDLTTAEAFGTAVITGNNIKMGNSSGNGYSSNLELYFNSTLKFFNTSNVNTATFTVSSSWVNLDLKGGNITNATIGSNGIWNGDKIEYNYGGTGLSTLTANKILQINSSGNGYNMIDLPISNTYTAGTDISISALNVISYTGIGGRWTETTGTLGILEPTTPAYKSFSIGSQGPILSGTQTYILSTYLTCDANYNTFNCIVHTVNPITNFRVNVNTTPRLNVDSTGAQITGIVSATSASISGQVGGGSGLFSGNCEVQGELKTTIIRGRSNVNNKIDEGSYGWNIHGTYPDYSLALRDDTYSGSYYPLLGNKDGGFRLHINGDGDCMYAERSTRTVRIIKDLQCDTNIKMTVNGASPYNQKGNSTSFPSYVGQWSNLSIPSGTSTSGGTFYYDCGVLGEGYWTAHNGDTYGFSNPADYNAMNFYDEDSAPNLAGFYITGSGSISTISDLRRKTDIHTYKNTDFEKYKTIRTVKYKMKIPDTINPERLTKQSCIDKYNNIEYGVIAQEFYENYPEMETTESLRNYERWLYRKDNWDNGVYEKELAEWNIKNEECMKKNECCCGDVKPELVFNFISPYKSVEYQRLNIITVGVVQELIKENETIKTELNVYKDIINKLMNATSFKSFKENIA